MNDTAEVAIDLARQFADKQGCVLADVILEGPFDVVTIDALAAAGIEAHQGGEDADVASVRFLIWQRGTQVMYVDGYWVVR